MPKKSAYVVGKELYKFVCKFRAHLCKFRAHLCMCNGSALHMFVQGLCVVHGYGGIREFHTVCIRVAQKCATQNPCIFLCNSDVQLSTIVQVSLAHIWYRLHTQLVTGTFVMPARTTTHVATHTTQKKATTHSHYSATRPWPMPPPSSLGDKTIKICYKDDVDCREGRSSSSRRRRHPG
jgi:hypothetical protein